MDPPTNAATGRTRWPRRPSGRYAIAIVAPRPAPAATPSRYGSASGFRNTPWYVAPASASIAPTRAARSTRGTRICQRIASSVGESEVDTPGTCSRAPADSRTAPTPRWTGPARTPIASDTRRNATAEHAHSGRSPRARTSGTRSATVAMPLLAQPGECRGHRAEEVHEARPPARGDRVVDADDRARADGADL